MKQVMCSVDMAKIMGLNNVRMNEKIKKFLVQAGRNPENYKGEYQNFMGKTYPCYYLTLDLVDLVSRYSPGRRNLISAVKEQFGVTLTMPGAQPRPEETITISKSEYRRLMEQTTPPVGGSTLLEEKEEEIISQAQQDLFNRLKRVYAYTVMSKRSTHKTEGNHHKTFLSLVSQAGNATSIKKITVGNFQSAKNKALRLMIDAVKSYIAEDAVSPETVQGVSK